MTEEILKKCELFAEMDDAEVAKMYDCIRPYSKIKRFSKGETLMTEGGDVVSPGIVLSGYVEASSVDRSGRESLISHIPTGGLFGEVLNAADRKTSPITLRASDDCEVMLIDQQKLIQPCSSACPCHMKLTQNLLRIISRKYWNAQTRIDYISASSLREKIMMYLSDVRSAAESDTFRIPMNREKLAAYLNADRSALSRELSAMKRDGLIDCDKDVFTVKYKI